MELLYLSRADVEAVELSMAEIIAALEEMFLEKGEGRVEMPPKPGIHPAQDSFLHAMPAWIPAMQAAGLKWIAGFPSNRARGLPYISGLMVLNDPATGLPLSVMDATWITAMRTGAATAVAAKRLARPGSRSVGILACGVQGRSNLEALACVLELERVVAFDIERSEAERYRDEMAVRLGLTVEVVDAPRAAVEGMHVVVTSGPILKAPSPVIEPHWLAPGVLACPIDFDSYFTERALAAADRLVTDDVAQFEHYRAAGYFQGTPTPDSDLGRIVCGAQPGRADDAERIVCINLGLALEDVATARLLYRRALERGLGTRLPL